MNYYLSVDSGGTKTAFLLTDETGKEIASITLGPANYLVNGLDTVLSLYKEGIEALEASSGLSRTQFTSTFIAMAGFGDIPEEKETIIEKVKENFPGMKIRLGNDTDNALSGSLLGEVGIHIIAGTGSIGLGYDLDGNYIRSGGWHHLFGGDEGSGYWIGCRLIQHFTKQADGREEKTELYSYLMDRYALKNPENILELVIEKWQGRREKIASISYDAYVLAKQGDSCALKIFQEAGKELEEIVMAIYHKGHFVPGVKVSYSGGVFSSFEFFKEIFSKELEKMKPAIQAPVLPPLQGGILIAMKEDGLQIDDEIISHLKEK